MAHTPLNLKVPKVLHVSIELYNFRVLEHSNVKETRRKKIPFSLYLLTYLDMLVYDKGKINEYIFKPAILCMGGFRE